MQYSAQFQQQMKTLAKDTKFYEDNDECPTCSQSISEEIKTVKLQNAKEKAKEFQTAFDKINSESTSLDTDIDSVKELLNKIRIKQTDMHVNNQSITSLSKQITSIRNDISSDVVTDLEKAKEDLSSYNDEQNTVTEEKLNLSDNYSYNQVIAELLKDTGIKTKIIKQYLPVINKLVNQYLQVLDFFVSFDLDESFRETIRSRHRDDFSYDSFSEGEKQRIDLALLFTWRQIAKMKNSVATNLLVLDETFDSSLDYDGIENLFKILHTLPDDSNIFIISHKGDILDGKFDSKMEFYKEKNFSKIK